MDIPNIPADLTPAERFAHVAKTVFSVSKQEVDDFLQAHPLPRQKPGPKPKVKQNVYREVHQTPGTNSDASQ